uniref:Uncharacterized protein n=1 Tax=Triticum urartu TaxID=4572 RepID=A0A8R7QCA6_TRIUA
MRGLPAPHAALRSPCLGVRASCPLVASPWRGARPRDLAAVPAGVPRLHHLIRPASAVLARSRPDPASRVPFPSPAPQDPRPSPLLEQELRLLASRQGRRQPLRLRLLLPAHHRTSADRRPSASTGTPACLAAGLVQSPSSSRPWCPSVPA